MTETNDFGLDQETIEWARKKREEDQRVSQRKQRLKENLENENFKYLYDNGLKDVLDKDPSVIDNDTATKMAMQMTANQIQNAEKAKSEPEVKPEQQPESAGSGPSTQGAPVGIQDAYEQPIGNLRSMDVGKFKNLSKSGRLCAESLKI